MFINSGCHFQDQGGIIAGDGTLIGHNVVLATINHGLDPKNNRNNRYASIKIGAHVWIGSNATVLPGVSIGDWLWLPPGRCDAGYSAAGGSWRRPCPDTEKH